MVSGIEEGNRLPSVPEVQARGRVDVAPAAATRARTRFFTATYNYVGSRFTQIDDRGAGLRDRGPELVRAEHDRRAADASTFTFDPELPAYNLVNLRLGLTRGSWEVALFLNNLTDERALLALDRERGMRARVGT